MSDVAIYKDEDIVITKSMLVTKEGSHALSSISGLRMEFNGSAKIMATLAVLGTIVLLQVVTGLLPVEVKDLFGVVLVLFLWAWVLTDTKKRKLIANLAAGGSTRLLGDITTRQAQAIIYAFSHAKAQSF